jgi:hypothetical protein
MMMNRNLIRFWTFSRRPTSLACRNSAAYYPEALEWNILLGMEDATMSRVKQASKKKRATRAAVPALGAAGLTFAMMGGASASAVPAADVQQTPNYVPTQAVVLSEEEIADVSLATFHLFEKENVGKSGVQEARGCGGGGRGCGGRGCRGGGRGCGGRGCGGCGGGGCCASWGACRFC